MITSFLNFFRYRDLLINLTMKELKLKYRNSVIGFFWSFLNPLLMITIYTIAFKTILRIQIDDFALFVFIGVVPWSFFQGSISQSTNSIVSNQGLIKKVYFPRAVIPLSIVMSNFINMIINFIIVFISLYFFKIEITYSIVLFPILSIVLFLITAGISLLLSVLAVKYRDISYLVDVFLIAFFYLTPIIYSSDMVPKPFITIINFNPLTSVIEGLRKILLEGKILDFPVLISSIFYAIIIFCVGLFVFMLKEKKIAEDL